MEVKDLKASVISTLDVKPRKSILFYLNGHRMELNNVDPEMPLLDFLREKGFTSVKKPCGEGGCGGCAVAVARYDHVRQRVHHFAVNSCLVPLPFIHACSVTTAEGIGTTDNLHRIQKDLAENHGTQCGFCSPGIITTLYALFADHPERTIEEIDEALSTNLCRCTGYRPIFDSARRYAVDFKAEDLGDLVKEQSDIEEASTISTKEHPLVTAEFPQELYDLPVEPVLITGPQNVWFKPATLAQMSAVRAKDGKKAVLVSGSTDLSFKQQYRPFLFQPILISTVDIKELKIIQTQEDGIEFGAATSINELGEFWKNFNDPVQQPLAKAFVSITRVFANYNVRNIGTIGGSLIAGDALSDLCPIFIGTSSMCRLVSPDGERLVSASDLIAKRDIRPDEILLTIKVPFITENDHIRSFKIAKRREDSQSLTSALMNVRILNKKVVSAAIAIGAVATIPFHCKKTQEAIINQEWDYHIFELMIKTVLDEIEVSPRVGYADLRKNLIRAIFYKFFIQVSLELGLKINEQYLSAAFPFERIIRKSKQTWTRRDNKVLGKQNPHVSAYGHTTGDAKFVGDIPVPPNCVYIAPVQSTKANAKIASIDPSEALALPGVIDFIWHKDIPGQKQISSIPPADEDVFAVDRVTVYGQTIGVIAADNERLAHKAALMVKVTYEDEQKPIVTIYDAMEAAKNAPDDRYYLVKEMGIKSGDPSNVESEITITGSCHFNNQEHFYLEPNTMLCMPEGTEGYHVYAACQNPNKMQENIAQVLAIKRSEVRCETMRVGGGFGGKQDRPAFYACAAAITCRKLKRPVRYVVTRQEDIQTAGMRHEYHTEYKLGCNKDGILNLIDVHFHSNAGMSMDLSQLVMDRSIYSGTGCYFSPNVSSIGTIYKTNKVSCTAFRGFGVPQSLFAIETAMAHLGHLFGVRPEVLKEKNLYKMHDHTATHYELPDDNTRKVWFACKESCDWDRQVKEVEEFNQKNFYKKRGIAMTPVVSTMGFESEFMMKGSSLVHIYGDGSVNVTHGGIEMGQGIHVKMQMICAETLQIDPEFVKVLPTATDKCVNMPPTAGSTGTDLHGRAVYNASKELFDRIQPIREAHPDWTWEQICSYCYFNKVDMQSSGFNRMPDSVYNHETHIGRESFYLIWTCCFCLIELDLLTGEHIVKRIDLVHDNGSSLNPGIDIGQLEGGFVQGQGLYTLEDMIWAGDGHIRTRNVTTYKIPTLDDIPDDFRVELLQNTYNNMGIYGSKASGEAGLRAGCSVIMALRDAIRAARHQFGHDEWFELSSPATIEKIRALIPAEIVDPTQ